MHKSFLTLALAAALAFVPAPAVAQSFDAPSTTTTTPRPVLWTNPGDIRSLDLFYGPGGKEHQPKMPVSFVEEEKKGSSPKFDVRDKEGKKWKAKVGPEARPETVASRLMWAVGYGANENYVVPELAVDGLPKHLSRGDEYRLKNGALHDVRLQRHSGEKVGTWSWRNNPFKGTREFNGLRVMMALLDNWDLKDANNALYANKKTGAIEYEVTDVGATFGPTHRTHYEDSKGNLKVYRRAKFITRRAKDYVDFAIVGLPDLTWAIFDPPYYIMEMHRRWIGKHIPRQDAKWVGSLLAQLSEQQLRDAFRAADFPPDQIDGFVAVLQQRIADLQKL
jgi:hypothetical protein